jgi:hypothetical protein
MGEFFSACLQVSHMWLPISSQRHRNFVFIGLLKCELAEVQAAAVKLL